MQNNFDLNTFESFKIIHENQLKTSGVPQHYYKTIFEKIHSQNFDSGEYFELLLLDYGDEERSEKDPVFTAVAIKEIKVEDPNCVFLLDHQITFKLENIRKDLQDNPLVVKRLCCMFGLIDNDDIEGVLKNMWKYCNFYSVNVQGNDQ